MARVHIPPESLAEGADQFPGWSADGQQGALTHSDSGGGAAAIVVGVRRPRPKPRVGVGGFLSFIPSVFSESFDKFLARIDSSRFKATLALNITFLPDRPVVLNGKL